MVSGSLARSFRIHVPVETDSSIKYFLPYDTHIKLEIYSITGQKIKTLMESTQTAGHKTVEWLGKNNSGEVVSSGLYIYVLRTGNSAISKKMLHMK